MKQIKVASIGFWHLHGVDYAREAAACPGVSVVAAWDDVRARGETAANKLGVPVVRQLDDVLADPAIDGVIVCNATAAHRDVLLRCLKAEKHVFVEKVLAVSLADAEVIADAARRSGLAFTVSMRRLGSGYVGQIAKLVADGAVGTITSARIRDSHPFALPIPGAPDGWLPKQFYDPVEAGGGILIDLCHPVYLLTAIMGLPDKVMTSFGHVTKRAVEDNAAVLMSYNNGAIGIAESSSAARISPFTMELHGTEGSILYSEPGIGALVEERLTGKPAMGDSPDDKPRLRVRSDRAPGEGWSDVAVAADAPSLFGQWIAQIRDGSRDESNLGHALNLTAVMEAAYKSATAATATSVSHPRHSA